MTANPKNDFVGDADYDQQYFFILQTDDDRLPSLTPDENTVDRNYSFEPQPLGSAPFMFFDGGADYARKQGIVPSPEIPDILVDGADLVVRSHIRDVLIALDLPGLHMHPAVFTDAYGKRHEAYWYLAFPESLDCWDRELSDFEEEPIRLGGFTLHSVYTYALDAAVLDKIPLGQRLLFKMGSTQDGLIVCHEDIAAIFRGNGQSGARLVGIPDY